MAFRMHALIFVLACALTQARPGSLVPFARPELEAIGTVMRTAIDDDGSVFIYGDFHAVDGIPRPGLAKLQPNGRLDETFTPAVTLGNRPWSPAFATNTRPTYFGAFWRGDVLASLDDRPARFEPTQIFALGNGNLYLRNHEFWTVLDAAGQIDPTALPGFDRNSPAPVPQFRHQDRLYLIDEDRKLIALDLSQDDLPDPTFTLDPTITAPVLQAIPKGNDLWIMIRQEPFDTILRLHADGRVDQSFPPLELRNGLANRLVSSHSSGFAIISDFTGPYVTCARVGGCGPTSTYSEVTWFNEIGRETGNIRVSYPLFENVSIFVRSSVDAIVKTGSAYTRRNALGNTDLFELIPTASPVASPDLPLTETTIDLLGSGSVFQRDLLIGGLRKFTTQGQPVTSHHVARLTTTATLRKVVPFPDGGYLIGGDFSPGLARVLPDGTLDPTFQPTFDCRTLWDFEVRSDGEVYLLLQNGFIDGNGFIRSNFLRLSATGEDLGDLAEGRSLTNNVSLINLLQDQSLLILNPSDSRLIPIGSYPVSGILRRFLPNGELDADWALHDPDQLGFGTFDSGGAQVFPLRDGRFLFGRRVVTPDGLVGEGIPGQGTLTVHHEAPDGWIYFVEQTNLRRWHPSFGLDDDFRYPPASPFDSIWQVQSGSRGKLYLIGQFSTAGGQGSLIRLHSTGQVDHTFGQPPLLARTAPAGVHQVLTEAGLTENDPGELSLPVIPAATFLRDDKLILFGVFDHPVRNIAAVTDTHTSGFSEYITATTGALQDPAADYDGDGTNNFGEYALGSHPAFPDNTTHQLDGLPPRVFGVPCNPEAIDVSRRIEVSDDLQTWRPATAADFTLETQSGCFRYRLQSSASPLFTRVVTEAQR